MGSIKSVLLFFIPGFIALAMSSLINPEYFEKSSQEKFAETLLLSVFSYFVVCCINPFTFLTNISLIFSAENNISGVFFLWAVFISIITGFVYGYFQPRILRLFYDFWGEFCHEKKENAYMGATPFLKAIFRDYPDNWCDVELQNGDMYHGEISSYSCHPKDKQAIFMKRVTLLKPKKDDSGNFEQHSLKEEAEGVYIPINQIVNIEIRANKKQKKT